MLAASAYGPGAATLGSVWFARNLNPRHTADCRHCTREFRVGGDGDTRVIVAVSVVSCDVELRRRGGDVRGLGLCAWRWAPGAAADARGGGAHRFTDDEARSGPPLLLRAQVTGDSTAVRGQLRSWSTRQARE